MNEKIKQLCEQAKAYATESTKDFTGDEPVVWMDYYTEKFAELIVQECLGQVEEQYKLISQDATMMSDTRWAYYVDCGVDSVVGIREHFGVEE